MGEQDCYICDHHDLKSLFCIVSENLLTIPSTWWSLVRAYIHNNNLCNQKEQWFTDIIKLLQLDCKNWLLLKRAFEDVWFDFIYIQNTVMKR